MDIVVIIQQMVMIFILIMIGAVLYKLKIISDDTGKGLSGIIVNVTNPAMLITSALECEEKLSNGQLARAAIIFAVMYVILIIFAFLIPIILRVEKKERYVYNLMSIFGNVGFMGIPIASAVLGQESLIIVSVCNLEFGLLIYTYGMAVIKKAATEADPNFKDNCKYPILKIFNVGTLASVLTIILYVFNIRLPYIAESTLSYAGRSTTFLSMVVLGISVIKMKPSEIFGNFKMYIFVVLRTILIPIIVYFAGRIVTDNELMLNTLVIMTAVPVANLPLMLIKQYGQDEKTVSSGIILSTVLSLVTIPLVCYILTFV